MTVRIRTILLPALLTLLTAACSTSVSLDAPTIPEPVIEKYPLKVGVRIPAEFEHFVHEEKVLGREDWTIDLGHSNASLFKQLFTHLFEDLVVLTPDEDAESHQFDALIEPSIEGFEFSTPEQSQTEAYAVWIRYRLLIYDSAGNKFANWPVSAYGKSQKDGMGGSDALQRAAVIAMRDAAALLITQMEKATGLSVLADGPIESSKENDETAVADNNKARSEHTARAVLATGLGGFRP